MVQAQQANDAGIAAVKHADHPAEAPKRKKKGFIGAVFTAVITLGWLIGGEITNNKRRFTL